VKAAPVERQFLKSDRQLSSLLPWQSCMMMLNAFVFAPSSWFVHAARHLIEVSQTAAV
jgi:hypothetical protein